MVPIWEAVNPLLILKLSGSASSTGLRLDLAAVSSLTEYFDFTERSLS